MILSYITALIIFSIMNTVPASILFTVKTKMTFVPNQVDRMEHIGIRCSISGHDGAAVI